jgi:25S rRNA (adenine2142-N1)-methyltransferase
MGRSTRARKEPITRTGQARIGKSSTATQATISRFHTLLKRQAQLKSKLESACSSKSVQELAEVEREMEDLGGLAAYQEASILGQDETRGGDTSKLLVTWLKELNIRPAQEGSKLR